jgi:hypothetical protein
MCVDVEDFYISLCNNKMVGTKAFNTARVPSLRDLDGPDTHVTWTETGSEVHDVDISIFRWVAAKGISPKARIAMYVVYGTSSVDIVVVVDVMLKDGVGILSMYVGNDPPPPPFHSDVVIVTLFSTLRKGIFVVLKGGDD